MSIVGPINQAYGYIVNSEAPKGDIRHMESIAQKDLRNARGDIALYNQNASLWHRNDYFKSTERVIIPYSPPWEYTPLEDIRFMDSVAKKDLANAKADAANMYDARIREVETFLSKGNINSAEYILGRELTHEEIASHKLKKDKIETFTPHVNLQDVLTSFKPKQTSEFTTHTEYNPTTEASVFNILPPIAFTKSKSLPMSDRILIENAKVETAIAQNARNIDDFVKAQNNIKITSGNFAKPLTNPPNIQNEYEERKHDEYEERKELQKEVIKSELQSAIDNDGLSGTEGNAELFKSLFTTPIKTKTIDYSKISKSNRKHLDDLNITDELTSQEIDEIVHNLKPQKIKNTYRNMFAKELTGKLNTKSPTRINAKTDIRREIYHVTGKGSNNDELIKASESKLKSSYALSTPRDNVKFGKYWIDKNKLDTLNILSFVGNYNHPINTLPSRKVSDALKTVVLEILNNMKLTTYNLTSREKEYLSHILKVSKLKMDNIVPPMNKKDFIRRLDLVIGEMNSGNDSKILKNELSQLLNICLSKGIITTQQAKHATKKYIIDL